MCSGEVPSSFFKPAVITFLFNTPCVFYDFQIGSLITIGAILRICENFSIGRLMKMASIRLMRKHGIQWLAKILKALR